jgi:hypothetical protein
MFLLNLPDRDAVKMIVHPKFLIIEKGFIFVDLITKFN